MTGYFIWTTLLHLRSSQLPKPGHSLVLSTNLTLVAALQGAGGLTYSQWLEMLLRIAESRLGPDGHSVWHETHPTLPSKITVLFDVFMKLK